MTMTLNPDDFDFELPDALIARYPAAERRGSRLLVLNKHTGQCEHQHFPDFADILHPGDLLVLNNTKVMPARLAGHKASGGKISCLIERVLDDEHCALAHIKASHAPKVDTELVFSDTITAIVKARHQDLFELDFGSQTVFSVLDVLGEVPIPPYLGRDSDASDTERYQTVYASHKGAVAAPTAGLHFDAAMLETLKNKGVQIAQVTLHVGAGTFQSLKPEQLQSGKLHKEWLHVDEAVCKAWKDTRDRGGRVFAVGTTSVRALETAILHGDGVLTPYIGDTQLFIRPGFQFQAVDALLTNFHLPKSSLMMLVSAFIAEQGRKKLLAAYKQAVEQEYRFYSYGDAMVIV